MSRQAYRANVLSASFPLLSSFFGHSVIIPQIDQYYLRSNPSSGNTAEDKIGVPQVLFLENVLPISAGLQSINYAQVVNPKPDPVVRKFDQAFWLRNAQDKRTLFVPAHGANYIYDVVGGNWASQAIIASFNSVVSVANIKQRTFIHYSKNASFYEWNDPLIEPVIFDGLSPTSINGIVTGGPYLIAYSDDTIYWCSIFEPTDFLPSLETTAGSRKVLSLKGKILYCTPIADGFLIFTQYNVISASYTSDPANPFNFVELEGSVGVDDPEKITKDTNARVQYMSSTAGLVRYNRNQMEVVFPEVTEFLNGRRFEYFNYTTKKVVEVDILKALKTKIAFIGNRYLVLSYGYDRLSFALILDVALNRWGKLRVEHVDAFEFIGRPSATDLTTPALAWEDLVGSWDDQGETTWAELGGLSIPGVVGDEQEPYKMLAFLQENGRVLVVNQDLPQPERIGVLMTGKYQLTRGRWIQFLEAWAENVGTSLEYDLSILKSYDGANFQDLIPLFRDPTSASGRQAKFLGDQVSQNFALLHEGKFDLSSLELFVDQAGQS